MRKITEHAVNAFENGGKLSEGNMSVHDGLMYLHGNLIAKYNDQILVLEVVVQSILYNLIIQYPQ